VLTLLLLLQSALRAEIVLDRTEFLAGEILLPVVLITNEGTEPAQVWPDAVMDVRDVRGRRMPGPISCSWAPRDWVILQPGESFAAPGELLSELPLRMEEEYCLSGYFLCPGERVAWPDLRIRVLAPRTLADWIALAWLGRRFAPGEFTADRIHAQLQKHAEAIARWFPGSRYARQARLHRIWQLEAKPMRDHDRLAAIHDADLNSWEPLLLWFFASVGDPPLAELCSRALAENHADSAFGILKSHGEDRREEWSAAKPARGAVTVSVQNAPAQFLTAKDLRARISLTAPGRAQSIPPKATAAADGGYHFENLHAGEYDLYVLLDVHAYSLTRIEVRAGAVTFSAPERWQGLSMADFEFDCGDLRLDRGWVTAPDGIEWEIGHWTHQPENLLGGFVPRGPVHLTIQAEDGSRHEFDLVIREERSGRYFLSLPQD